MAEVETGTFSRTRDSETLEEGTLTPIEVQEYWERFQEELANRKLQPNSITAVQIASGLGWRVIFHRGAGLTLEAPDGFTFKMNRRTKISRDKFVAMAIEHGDPLVTAAWMAMREAEKDVWGVSTWDGKAFNTGISFCIEDEPTSDEAQPEKIRIQCERCDGKTVYYPKTGTIGDHFIPGTAYTCSQEALEELARQRREAEDKLSQPESLTPEAVMTAAPNERAIVEERPFLARRSKTGNLAYISKVILERVWSDGTTDYLCQVCREFSSENPYSVRAHHHAHTNRGEATLHDPSAVTVVEAGDRSIGGPGYQPRDTTIETLAEFLKSIDYTNEKELAEAILKFQHRDAGPPIERTPEQLIDHIRRLVDRGEYAALRAQVTDLLEENELLYMELDDVKKNDKVSELEQKLEEGHKLLASLMNDLEAANDRADRYMESLRTLHELTGGLIPEDVAKG